MEGKELLIALGRTTGKIKLLSSDGKTVLATITAQQAIERVTKGTYVGHGRKKRQVKAIREWVPTPEWDPKAWRVSNSAALPTFYPLRPGVDYFGNGVHRKENAESNRPFSLVP